MIALDRSLGLLSVARAQKGDAAEGVGAAEGDDGDVVGGVEECVRGDLGFEGWRDGVFVSITRPLSHSQGCHCY
jgi:hypothetical protein